MSEVEMQQGASSSVEVDAETNVVASLPMRKRKQETDLIGSDESKKLKTPEDEDELYTMAPSTTDIDKFGLPTTDIDELGLDRLDRPPMSKAREVRLEQNRKAARESRRRKKIMVEELQRSVIFFSRANSTLKQQNVELSRILLDAQAKIAANEQNGGVGNAPSSSTAKGQSAQTQSLSSQTVSVNDTAEASRSNDNNQLKQAVFNAQAHPQQTNTNMDNSQLKQAVFSVQAQQTNAHHAAQAAATQAMYESQGFPPAAARAAAQTFITAPASAKNAESQIEVKDTNAPDTKNAMVTAQNPANLAMAGNPWPLLFSMAPGQMQMAAAAAAAGTPQAAAQAQNPNNPYVTMLLPQFLTTANGMAFPVIHIPNFQQNPNQGGNDASSSKK
mmetsp:Transcript_8799/g.9670  ORF Transcript_8799/g.9670 Transcript_8799/m.9670 type:complete len:388 (+) Transcript_8799:150-1313(+)